MGFWYRRRLATGGFRQAMATKFVTSGTTSAWRRKRFRQAAVTDLVIYGALGAWRHVSPAMRSGSWQRLAVRVPRQAIYTTAALSFDYEFVIYSESSDSLRVRLLVFLELWLGTYPLSCASR